MTKRYLTCISCYRLARISHLLRRKSCIFMIACLLLCLSQMSAVKVCGQSATATLSGTVTDQNGAVVPGALVIVLNVGTRLQREAVTGEQGSFTIPLLPPSRYTVTVRRVDFAPVEVQEVVLN